MGDHKMKFCCIALVHCSLEQSLFSQGKAGEQGWRVVRALVSHECGPGSIPGFTKQPF